MNLKFMKWALWLVLGMVGCGGGRLTLLPFNGANLLCIQDADCDGIQDADDNCPQDYNPSQNDSDGNGVGEICEPFLPGGEDCSLRTCETSDDCQQYVRFCPGAEQELGAFPACCDGNCFNSEGSATLCPPGTCLDITPVHCESSETCNSGEICAEGCCAPESGPEGCFCECPPESECELCPPGDLNCGEAPFGS